MRPEWQQYIFIIQPTKPISLNETDQTINKMKQSSLIGNGTFCVLCMLLFFFPLFYFLFLPFVFVFLSSMFSFFFVGTHNKPIVCTIIAYGFFVVFGWKNTIKKSCKIFFFVQSLNRQRTLFFLRREEKKLQVNLSVHLVYLCDVVSLV